MRLSIIIVSWKVKDLLQKCLVSLQAERRALDFEVWVVDNHSQDGTVEMVQAEFSWVKLIASQDNNGFAKGNNLAIQQIVSSSDYIFLLNPDTEVKPGALHTLVQFMDDHPEAGAVGPKLLNPDGSLQPSCKSFPTVSTLVFNSLFLDVLFSKSKIFGRYEMSWWLHDDIREVDQPMGAALLVRQAVIDQIGLMDEQFYMFFDEVDWCYRIKQAGYSVYFTPEAEIIHHGGQSIKSAEMRMSVHWHRSLKRFFQKHYGIAEWVTGGLIAGMFLGKVIVGASLILVLMRLAKTLFCF